MAGEIVVGFDGQEGADAALRTAMGIAAKGTTGGRFTTGRTAALARDCHTCHPMVPPIQSSIRRPPSRAS